MTKIPKYTGISLFFAIFVKVSKDFVDQNVENVQQRMKLLSNGVDRGDKCSFERKIGTIASK